MLVRDFHRMTSEPINDTPELPDDAQAALRVELLMEEVLELAEALGVRVHLVISENPGPYEGDVHFDRLRFINEGEQSLVEAVDALRDMEYLIHGTELVLGTTEVSDDTFMEVHRSNMEKQPVHYGKKAIKPRGWKPPQIAALLRKRFPKKALLFRK
jgi:predicted HAD superfamily Cof-like phosphohydrolase